MHLIDILTPNKDAKVRLFCFHYGGGSSVSFYPWMNKVLHSAELVAVDLPGRGRSMNKPLLHSIDKVTTLLLEQIEYYTDKPLIFFGHSVGALICFELAKAMKAQHLRLPVHLILSGCVAPQNLYKRQRICNLSTEEFVQALKRYNGISHDVLNEPSLMELFLPIIKADISIIENYQYRENDPLDCNITTIAGINDRTVLLEDVKSWETQTSVACDHYMLEGDHFFIKTNLNKLLLIINQIIEMYCDESPGVVN